MVAGRPVWIQSPARTTFVPSGARRRALGVLRRRRGEGRALLLDDLPGRQVGRKAGERRRLAPDLGRKLVARTVDKPVGVADGDREPVWKGEQPFDHAVDDAEDRRLARRRRDLRKWALTIARNSSGAVRPGRRSCADPGRHADNHPHRLRRASADALVEVEPDGALARRNGSPAGGRRSGSRAVRAARKASAGSMKLRASPWPANSGWQALPPAPSVSRSRAGGKRGGAFRRVGVERGGQERAPQSLVERSLAAPSPRRPSRVRRLQEQHAERSEIFAQRRARRPPLSDRTATMGHGPR